MALVLHIIMSPPPLGRGGTSKFTVVSHHPNVSLCPRLCQTLLHNISYSFLLMAFKFSDIVTMDKTLNWLTFRNLGAIFKVTEGHYV